MFNNVIFHHDLWDALVCYISMLFFAPVELCDENYWHVSFAELVLDFEFFTGKRVHDKNDGFETTWFRKAQIMRVMWRRVFKHTAQLRQLKIDFPEGNFATLRAFGVAQSLSGLRRRPRFLMAMSSDVSMKAS